MVKLLRQFRCRLLYKSRWSFSLKLNELQIVGRRCRMFNFDEYMVVFPNAKINIGLFVTGKRPDGFHNLETVFYPIELRDILEITEIKGERGSCVFTSTGIPIDCPPEKNLVSKAYAILADEFDLPSVDVHLHKMIPYGAGLGGGSADAAFMLVGLNQLFSLGLNEERLTGYAARVGSDCPFFVLNRPVFAFGKGELMETIDVSLRGYHVVLVKPDRGVATPEAYRGITPRAASFDLRELGKLPVEQWNGVVVNDFEDSVIPKVPEIQEIKHTLRELGAVYVSMTGSGSAVYGLFSHPVEAGKAFPEYFVWQGE